MFVLWIFYLPHYHLNLVEGLLCSLHCGQFVNSCVRRAPELCVHISFSSRPESFQLILELIMLYCCIRLEWLFCHYQLSVVPLTVRVLVSSFCCWQRPSLYREWFAPRSSLSYNWDLLLREWPVYFRIAVVRRVQAIDFEEMFLLGRGA